MDSFIEEHRFFDADEEGISSGPDCFQSFDSNSSGVDNWASCNSDYEVWNRIPKSVQERRKKFLNLMGLHSGRVSDVQDCECRELQREGIDRIVMSSGAVLRISSEEHDFSSSRSSFTNFSNEASDVLEESISNICRDGGAECREDELGSKFKQSRLQTASSSSLFPRREGENLFGSSSAVSQQVEKRADKCSRSPKRVKSKWFSRLRSFSCMSDKISIASSLRPADPRPKRGARVQRVKVRHSKKRWKELSALFIGQDIEAHEGSILTMKFSLDGQYLATAGEDSIVRVWQVVEDARSNETDIPDIDPSCIYFTVNNLSELAPLVIEKEKLSRSRSLRQTQDSSCVIFPPRVFRILEVPIHHFHGHSGEILDLSWSKNNCLLSSSVDKTVRLWQVGCESCLNVFSHSNYVTCVQFNPVDDNHFISGSIDGKVRIWEVGYCHVVDWIDIRDIVTAVCYQPDGKGAVVGSMTGTCRFYEISDDHFELGGKTCLHAKKKNPSKRITGFQYFPQHPGKLVVTCADSQVRILNGINVVGKYKAARNTGNQLFASLTSDGKHIVSACEDSNVYMWNCGDDKDRCLRQPKVIKSWERFSVDASVAIPWHGMKPEITGNGRPCRPTNENKLPFPSSPAFFYLGQEHMIESFPKGSALWPEEKLLGMGPRSSSSPMRKSHFKFLKSSCQSTLSCHAWDMVIVTAGWDGRIKTFHNYGLPVAV